MSTTEGPALPDEDRSGASRREFVRRAALAGGLGVWVAPTIRRIDLSRAQPGSPAPGTATTEDAPGPVPTEPPPEQRFAGCRTQGYWKNHADRDGRYDATWDRIGGPDAQFFDTGKSYLEMLETPTREGHAFFILAHQWIAAQLNLAAGARASASVDAAFSEARDILATWAAAQDIPKDDPARSRAIELAATLDAFNNGVGCS